MEQYISKDALVAEIRKYKNNAEAYLKYHHNHNDKLVHSFEQEKLVMCELLSFLNTLEVKEVGNIWHDASETPKGAGDKEILVQFTDYHTSVLEIDDWEYLDHQTKWAYLKDLI